VVSKMIVTAELWLITNHVATSLTVILSPTIMDLSCSYLSSPVTWMGTRSALYQSHLAILKNFNPFKHTVWK
jgi:hypothetical protein